VRRQKFFVIFAEYAVVSRRWMMSSRSAGVKAFIVRLLNGLMVVVKFSGENVGVFGGSAAGEDASAPCCSGVGLIRMGSIWAGINVSRAALG
jgi:hypothetical protein